MTNSELIPELPVLEVERKLFWEFSGYDYKKFCQSIGYSTRCGAYYMRPKRHAHDFEKDQLGRRIISKDYAETMISNSKKLKSKTQCTSVYTECISV